MREGDEMVANFCYNRMMDVFDKTAEDADCDVTDYVAVQNLAKTYWEEARKWLLKLSITCDNFNEGNIQIKEVVLRLAT